jgi:hypothetical protein
VKTSSHFDRHPERAEFRRDGKPIEWVVRRMSGWGQLRLYRLVGAEAAQTQ